MEMYLSCAEHLKGVATAKRPINITINVNVMWNNCPLHFFYISQAINGVSNKSPYPAQQLSINITTNQAGE